MAGQVAVSAEVAAVLSAAVIDGAAVKLTGSLDRKLYAATDKVLQALGGKWDKRAKAHVFPRDAGALLDAALADGRVIDTKKALEQFDTPHDLARRMARMAAIGPDDWVLEPSAGIGNLIRAIGPEHPNMLAVEIDHARFRVLQQFGSLRAVNMDFLQYAAPPMQPTFDAVLMNPPFSRNQDIKHIRAAWSLLRPGGRLVAITSPHWRFAQDRESADSRGWFAEIGASDEDLPAGTFKDSGTQVGSRLIFATKAA